jgi:hypothetical protein
MITAGIVQRSALFAEKISAENLLIYFIAGQLGSLVKQIQISLSRER